jgi:hypothetical protein
MLNIGTPKVQVLRLNIKVMLAVDAYRSKMDVKRE